MTTPFPYHQHYTHCTLSTDDNALSISSALYPLYIVYRLQLPFYIISIIPTVHCLQMTTPFPYHQHYTHFTLSTDDNSLSISSALYPLYRVYRWLLPFHIISIIDTEFVYRWHLPFHIISIIPTVYCLQMTTSFPYHQHYTHCTLSTDDNSLSNCADHVYNCIVAIVFNFALNRHQ